MKAVTFRTGRIVCAAFVVMLCLGAGSAALSQSNNRSTISGFVFDPDRRPIPDAWVELLNEVNSLVQRVRTNSSGRFFFSGLSQGRFTIRVLSMTSGLESRPEDVEIAGIGVTGRQLADNVQRDIYMYRRKSDTEVDQLTGVLYAQNVPADAQAAYKKALDDINDKRVVEGVEGLERAISIFPTYLAALEKLGMMRLAEGKYQDAKDIFQRAVNVYDRSFSSWYGLGYASFPLKEYDQTISAMEKAIALKGDSMRALLLLGLAHRSAAHYPQAETALLKAAKAAGGDAPDIHWNLALLYAHNMQRYKDAADQLELYVKQSPGLENKEQIKKLIKQFREKAG